MKEFNNNLVKYDFKMEEIKLFDSFAGIGALHQSLKELGVPVKLVGISEIDVDAIISYVAVHKIDINKIESLDVQQMRDYLMARNIGYDFKKNKSSIPRMKKDKLELLYKSCVATNNLGDIGLINTNDIPNFDLFNMSFPCTDLSIAGKQQGMIDEEGNKTRSGLYVEGIRIIKNKKPKYIMIENVKNLIGKKFINDFYSIVNEIESYGYKCYYPKKENGHPTCLNAKDYGIPQNRERIYVICIRNDVDNKDFNFSKGFDSELRLKDVLEDEVDEKYYLNQEVQNRFKRNDVEDIDRNELNIVGTTAPDFRTIGVRDVTYGTNGIISTLIATDYKQPKQILETNNKKEFGILTDKTDKNFFIDKHNRIQPFNTKENYIQWDTSGKGSNSQQDRVYYQDKLSPTLSCCNSNGDKSQVILTNKEDIKETNITTNYRIRKLTPKECWRLMGFRDECIDRCIEIRISDSQLYKQAGNSIVVNVLYYIFKELFKDYIITNN